MWVTVVKATYARDEVERAKEVIADVLDGDSSVKSIIWRGQTVTIVDVYGDRSKYDAAKPAVSALQEIFDPIANSEYYQPWPYRVRLETKWAERRACSRNNMGRACPWRQRSATWRCLPRLPGCAAGA